MLPRKIISEDREKIKKGFNRAAEIVGSTFGPGGSNVAIGRHYNTALITNDGVSVAKQIHLDDEIEDIGAGFVRDLTYEADQGGGDGTTTAAVLANALLEDSWKGLFAGGFEIQNPKMFSRQLEKLREDACEALDKMARKVEGYEDIKNVATISVESEKYGKMIADMFEAVGQTGYVYVEHDFGFEIKTKIIDGFQIDSGLPSVDYSTHGSFTAELGLPHILALNKEVNADTLNQISAAIKNSSINSVIILASGFTDEALATLSYLFNQSELKGGKVIPMIPITMPVTYREILLRDICALTGATFNPEIITLQSLGEPFKKVIIKKNKTYFIGAPKNIESYVKDLLAQKDDMVQADKDRMDKRIARLTGGVGIIRVGGETDAERMYWYHKIKDAVNATRSAIKDGVVSGAGIALSDLSGLNQAFEAPYKLLCNNLGMEIEESDEIIDAVAVVKNSVRKAISAVIQVILTKYVIANRRPTLLEESRLLDM